MSSFNGVSGRLIDDILADQERRFLVLPDVSNSRQSSNTLDLIGKGSRDNNL